MPKVFFVTFHQFKGTRPAKFVVVAKSKREAVELAWTEGGAAFQRAYGRQSGEAVEIKRGARRIL